MLKLGFTRISPTHHRLDVTRGDGSKEELTLETRSALEHDFIHLALETEAGLKSSFFGLLDSGQSYADLSGKSPGTMVGTGETLIAEIVIGAMTGFVQGKGDANVIVPGAKDYLTQLGETPPAWLTPELVMRVKERFRRLKGEWKATPFGQTMEITFGQ